MKEEDRMRKALLITLTLFMASPIVAQVPAGSENNAALRYWNAFAQMSDATITEAQSHQLEAIANGTSAWDESAFGKLLDDNAQAVETMVRGTSFPYCAWGLDYKLGADTPIPQIPRGRALARLNVLTAQRLAAQGNSKDATLHLLAGIRFARDLSQDMSLIGALTGKLALVSDLNAAVTLAQSNKLSKSDREKLAQTVRALSPDIFDWSQSIQKESGAIQGALVQLEQAKDPAQYLAKWGVNYGDWNGKLRPSTEEIRQYDSVMAEAARAFRLPPSQAEQQLATIAARIDSIGPAFRAFTPSLTRANASRKEVEELRQKFLQSM
jgi:hypothetical protein